MTHYLGGLAEWFYFEHQPSAIAPAPLPASAPQRRGRGFQPWSVGRFLEVLADRSVGELFRLWVAVVAGFGVLYWLMSWVPSLALVSGGVPLRHDFRGLLSALYFSAVTATSVGFGDIVPIGGQRVLAIAEAVSGLVIFGCLVSKFVSRRQEALIGEIHRIAFEDRLGCVRTNLHLVRTELQATVRLCEGEDMPPPEAIARVDSAAMIFVGELHAIHDLLYRPQDAPDEADLEAILAGLASVFREFHELIRCVRREGDWMPPALRTTLSTMSRLAADICGECVPRDYAPALRKWMDEIQRTAAAIEQP